MKIWCKHCEGRGWCLKRLGPSSWAERCAKCRGRGARPIPVGELTAALQTSPVALRRLDHGFTVFPETYVRVLDRIAAAYPEALS